MARPKHGEKKDRNHLLVRTFCEGVEYRYAGFPLYLLDTSSLGGESVDWMMWFGFLCISVEVKAPETPYRLTDGEKQFMVDCPGVVLVVTSEQELADALARLTPVVSIANNYLKDIRGRI